MNSKKKCVDYEKIMTRKIEKEEMKISLIPNRREALYIVSRKSN